MEPFHYAALGPAVLVIFGLLHHRAVYHAVLAPSSHLLEMIPHAHRAEMECMSTAAVPLCA